MKFQRTQEDEIIHLCKILNNELRCGFDKKLQHYELTSQQGRVLFFIDRCENSNIVTHQNDIEKHLGLSKSTVSGLVSRLESKGFIIKEPELPYIKLTLTDKGKDIINAFTQGREIMNKKVFKQISSEEKKQIHDVLTKLVDNIKEEEK